MLGLQQLPPNVIALICDRLLAHDRDASERAIGGLPTYTGWFTLATLARTCRAFHDPALDRIWHTLPDIAPLLYTMPRDLWVEETVGKPPYERVLTRLAFVRPLWDDDFRRFAYYARRVRRILRDIECDAVPSRVRRLTTCPSVLLALAARFPDGALLPRLQVLHVSHIGQEGTYRALPVLFGPHLSNIFEFVAEPSPALAKTNSEFAHMLKLLRKRSPLLSVFQHCAYPAYPAMATAISDALCGFPYLVQVSIEPTAIHPHALLYLATLRRLRKLDVWIHHGGFTDEVLARFRALEYRTSFPALRHVSLTHARGLAACMTLLGFIRSPFLEGISVKSASPHTPMDELVDLLNNIGNRSFSSQLRRLTVTVQGIQAAPNSHEPPGPLPASALEPLLRLRSLAVLVLDIPHPIDIDDALLHAMSAAWPRLGQLELGVGRAPPQLPGPPRATLAGLLGFAHRSKHLWALGLHVRTDVKRLPDTLREGRPGRGAVQECLHTLSVGRSPMEYEDVLPVAAFLSDVFPGLCGVECGWEFDDEDELLVLEERLQAAAEAEKERIKSRIELLKREGKIRRRWERVEELVPVFARVRQEERTWAVKHGKRVKTPADAGVLATSQDVSTG